MRKNQPQHYYKKDASGNYTAKAQQSIQKDLASGNLDINKLPKGAVADKAFIGQLLGQLVSAKGGEAASKDMNKFSDGGASQKSAVNGYLKGDDLKDLLSAKQAVATGAAAGTPEKEDAESEVKSLQHLMATRGGDNGFEKAYSAKDKDGKYTGNYDDSEEAIKNNTKKMDGKELGSMDVTTEIATQIAPHVSVQQINNTLKEDKANADDNVLELLKAKIDLISKTSDPNVEAKIHAELKSLSSNNRVMQVASADPKIASQMKGVWKALEKEKADARK